MIFKYFNILIPLLFLISGCDSGFEHDIVIRNGTIVDGTGHSRIKGDILLAEDLDGAGHVWRFLRDGDNIMRPWVRCYVHLGKEYEHFISKLKEM